VRLKHDTTLSSSLQVSTTIEEKGLCRWYKTDVQLDLEKECNFIRKKLRNQCFELKIFIRNCGSLSEMSKPRTSNISGNRNRYIYIYRVIKPAARHNLKALRSSAHPLPNLTFILTLRLRSLRLSF
jgi:hypothetical protein